MLMLNQHLQVKKKQEHRRKDKTMLFGVNSKRCQVPGCPRYIYKYCSPNVVGDVGFPVSKLDGIRHNTKSCTQTCDHVTACHCKATHTRSLFDELHCHF